MRRLTCALLALLFALGLGLPAEAGDARVRLRLHSRSVIFVPNAVLLTPNFSAKFAAGSLSNSPTFVLYTRFRALAGTTTIPTKNQSCAGTIAFGNYLASDGSAENQTGLNWVCQDSNASGGVSRYNGGNSTTAGGIFNSATSAINVAYDDMQWHTMLWFGDATCAPATHFICGSVYIDDVQVVAGFSTPTDFTGTKTIGFATRAFYLNAFDTGQGSGQVELSQFYLATGIASPVVGSTNAPSFDITKFGTRAVPVDFGTTGANPLPGVTPVIFMCNAPATFLTNCGSGPTPTAVQQVTSTVMEQAYNTAIKPGEVADRPYVKKTFGVHWNAVPGCAASSGTCTAGSTGGVELDAGDKQCWVVDIGNTSNTANDNFAMSGYTNVFGAGSAGTIVATGNNGQNNINLWMGCKTVVTPVAAGTDAGPVTFTWTDNSGGGFQVEGNITSVIIGKYGAGGTTPTVNTAAGSGQNGTTFPLPNVTAPAGKSLLFGLNTPAAYEFTAGVAAIGPPTTSEGLVGPSTFGSGGTGNEPFMWWEKLSASGTVSRTAQGNPNNTNVGAQVIFN